MIDADRYFDMKESELMKRPECSCCHEHIQSDEYIVTPDGETLCYECEYENARDLWLEFGREYFLERYKE